MLEIEIKDLTLGFGERTLFENATFNVFTGDKMGIVGANGCGKTTLLRAILSPDRPSGITVARGISIGYLEQQLGSSMTGTVLENATDACRELLLMEQEIEALTAKMAEASGTELEAISEKYSRLCQSFEERDGYSVRSRIIGVLRGMGLTDEFFNRDVEQLSGGEKARLAISCLLLRSHDVLLLDEPTNHLDLRAAQWLTDFLCTLKTTVLVVSHDRYLLDRLCGSISEISGGKVTTFKGNYTDFRKKNDERRRLAQKAFDEQQIEIKRQQEIIKKYRSFNREKSIKAAESREKVLERMELVDAPERLASMRLSFKSGERTGNELLRLTGFSAGYDAPLLKGVDLLLTPGERICIVGDNGCGKTTLLKSLLGRIEHGGEVKWGTGVKCGYYDQHHKELDENNTVMDEIWLADRKLTQTQVRSAAAAMLFSGEDVFKRLATLSGGEKARCALCKLSLMGCNVLLMDEPTNHLDMTSREILEEALESFEGTVICVSHDRYFINRIASQVWQIKDCRLEQFVGNYDNFLEQTRKNPAVEQKPAVNKTAEAKKRANDRAERERIKAQRAKKAELERKIAMLEQEIAGLEELFASPDIYYDTELLLTKQSRYKEAQAELDEAYEQWME